MRSYNIFQHAAATGAAGQEAEVQLDTSRDTRYLVVTLSATVTIAGAVAAAIRNLGSVAAIFDRFRISEGGADTGFGDPRLFAFASEYHRGSPGTRTRLTSTAIGATNLVERILIPMERLTAVMPKETRYRVRNPGTRFSFFASVNATPGARVAEAGGGGTVTISNIRIEVRQYVAEPDDADLPVLAPRWREQMITVGGTNAQLRHELDIGGDYIRGITVLQETTTVGLVTDIINGVQLRTDRGFVVGEANRVDWDDLAADMEFESGGNVFAAEAGRIVHFDFQTAGRLSNLLSPRHGDNLRFLFDVQTSASAGTSQIRTLLHLLSRDEYVGPGGRRVVSPRFEIPV